MTQMCIRDSLRSLQLSEEYGLYRQDYCGCEFSAKARGIEK